MANPFILEEIWKAHIKISKEDITLSDWFNRYYEACGKVVGVMAKCLGVSRQTIYKHLWKHKMIPERSWEVYTIQGITGNVTELCKHFGMKPACVFNRMARGYTLEEALTEPLHQRRKGPMNMKITYGGRYLTLTDHAKRYGLEPTLVWGRYKSGLSLDKCFAGSKNN